MVVVISCLLQYMQKPNLTNADSMDSKDYLARDPAQRDPQQPEVDGPNAYRAKHLKSEVTEPALCCHPGPSLQLRDTQFSQTSCSSKCEIHP